MNMINEINKFVFHVDAPAPLNAVLMNLLELLGATSVTLVSGGEPIVLTSKISGERPVILQYFSEEDFRQAEGVYFANSKTEEIGAHPLKYRWTFDEISKEAGLNGNKPAIAKAYIDRTLPVIYCVDFDFTTYLKDKTKSNNIFFFDSSIWQRIINLNARFPLADLDSVISYFARNAAYWERLVSVETLEYQTRLFREQHLSPLDPKLHSTHGTALNLCSWTSETIADRKIKTDDKTTPKPEIALAVAALSPLPPPVLPRRFLLVDDFWKQELRACDDVAKENVESPVGSIAGACKHSKGSRILELLRDVYNFKGVAQKQPFDVYCVASAEDAKSVIQKQPFDVILLDYVLGYVPVVTGCNEKRRETGVELLDAITSEKSDMGRNIKNSVDDNLWVFPVSSFADAFIADMLNGDIKPYNEFFYWSVGADPIRQPNQFVLEMRSFLAEQDKILRKLSEVILDFMFPMDKSICDYKTFHCFITSNQGKLERLFKSADQLTGSRLIHDFVQRDKVVSPTLERILEYLENYLRLRRFYKTSARDACLRDLHCMHSLAVQTRTESDLWLDWIIGEVKAISQYPGTGGEG